MGDTVKNFLVIGAIAFAAIWAGNWLLRKMGAPDLQV